MNLNNSKVKAVLLAALATFILAGVILGFVLSKDEVTSPNETSPQEQQQVASLLVRQLAEIATAAESEASPNQEALDALLVQLNESEISEEEFYAAAFTPAVETCERISQYLAESQVVLNNPTWPEETESERLSLSRIWAATAEPLTVCIQAPNGELALAALNETQRLGTDEQKARVALGDKLEVLVGTSTA